MATAGADVAADPRATGYRRAQRAATSKTAETHNGKRSFRLPLLTAWKPPGGRARCFFLDWNPVAAIFLIIPLTPLGRLLLLLAAPEYGAQHICYFGKFGQSHKSG